MKTLLPLVMVGIFSATFSFVTAAPDPDPDFDGIPTDWEEAHGLLPDDSNLGVDSDDDGVDDFDEFLADTHPRDPEDYLKIKRFAHEGDTVVAILDTSTNRVYWVMYCPEILPPDDWDDFTYPILVEPAPGNGVDDRLALSGFPLDDMVNAGHIAIRATLP